MRDARRRSEERAPRSMDNDVRRQCDILKSKLENERSTWIPHWRDLSDYIAPWRGRFTVNDVNLGTKRMDKIVDPTGPLALRTLQSGMMSGITNPAREWFKLATPDDDLNDNDAVKDWLHYVEKAIYSAFRRSNVYNSLHVIYGDVGCFGTGAITVEEDDEQTMRCGTWPIGSFSVSSNFRGQVDTAVRTYVLTVRQLVERFGLDAVSPTVRGLWDRSSYEESVEVVQAVYPNRDRDVTSKLSKDAPYSSITFETGYADNLLKRSGFRRFPVLCPRWSVDGEDVWGHGPGMDALPDIKQLQSMVRKKGRAVEKMIDPPLVAGPEMRNSTVSGIPGGITYANMRDGRPSVAPLYQVDPRVDHLRADIQEIQGSVKRAFYEDLFLMLANSDRRQITAREVEERHEEKMLMLGPVLERLDFDLLGPLIDRTFEILQVRGDLPEPPQELQGVDLRVEYVNVLAQAQKMMGIGGIESAVGFVSQIAAVDPSILDKVDLDQAVEEYNDKLGLSPKITRSPDQVAAMRQQRQQQQAQQQAIANIQAGAGAAKDLSGAKLNDDNALSALMRGLPGQQQ